MNATNIGQSPLEAIMGDLLTALGTKRPVFITGAGVSLASKIPTFRGNDKGAVWETHIQIMGTNRFFQLSPEKSWAWYLHRFSNLSKAEPNPAHYALAQLENLLPGMLLITQNIDSLHHRAGSQKLIEVHGSARKMRCSRDGCELGALKGFLEWDDKLFEEFITDPIVEKIPCCPKCNSLLRPHILWFDEYYEDHEDYNYLKASVAAWDQTCLVLAGTSNQVGITKFLLEAAAWLEIPVFNIDPYHQIKGVTNIAEKAECALPQIVEALQHRG